MSVSCSERSLRNIFIPDSVDDSMILSQSSSRHSNLEVGQISHQSWVMGNDSLRSSPRRSTWSDKTSVPLLELDRFGILLGEREEGQVSIVMGGIFSIEARDMDTKLLSALGIYNNTLLDVRSSLGIVLVVLGTDLPNLLLSLHRHDNSAGYLDPLAALGLLMASLSLRV
ncbi:hypothetical protein Tco_0623960 [Tanacetum coccineum]|uniref:Uncharacterized protein n=1 Tax=Tanacetum coccineum TaxID=301880 RepID=A0ABQ4WCJ3_9ASTR